MHKDLVTVTATERSMIASSSRIRPPQMEAAAVSGQMNGILDLIWAISLRKPTD